MLGLDVNKPVTMMIRLDQSDLPNLVPITDFFSGAFIHSWLVPGVFVITLGKPVWSSSEDFFIAYRCNQEYP